MTKVVITSTSGAEPIKVRRRNVQGAYTEAISVSLPKELHQTINGIVVETKKSRSLVISELIKKGLGK